AELVRAITRSSYAAGASYVDAWYGDAHVRRAMIEQADEEILTYSPPWLVSRYAAAADGGALIMIAGEEEPELLADLDQTRVGKARMLDALSEIRRGQGGRTMAWTIVAWPTAGWAELMFGEPDVQRLWDAIASTVGLEEDDPVAAWKTHVDKLRARAQQLNELKLDSLHYSGPGTDLTVGVLENHRWLGGGVETTYGAFHVPNMPTEEVFTTPDRTRADGTVRSTYPLQLGGTIVRDLEFRMEGGRIVDVSASSGVDAVRAQLDTDEGARHLGELALVDGESRVGKTGLTFYNTLFDENATCHIAFGNAIMFGTRGLDGLSPDELNAKGFNTSNIHTDFMVGGPEVTVTGTTRDGREVTILEEDVWQLS
ncbi:MAG TPA: aminopeptidase, partial [Gaiellaceae bacterium]|nr:aminopeptidase [Gaiellaceae bacterium]